MRQTKRTPFVLSFAIASRQASKKEEGGRRKRVLVSICAATHLPFAQQIDRQTAAAAAPMTKIHYFTDEFPDKDYRATTASTHPQTKLWPAYLPVDDDRLFIFERSKNAQLVVYTANYADREKRALDPKWPLDINWQSFGWTTQPTSNATGIVERKMAWGYAHKPMDASSATTSDMCSYGSQFVVTLNALPSRVAHLYFDSKGRLVLQTTISDVASRLLKVFVCTTNSRAFVPKVLYVELYGTDLASGDDTYERITVSA